MKNILIILAFLLPITVSAQLLRSYGVVEIGSTFPTSTVTGAKFAYRTVDSSFYRWISGNTWVKIVEPSIVPDTLYLTESIGTSYKVSGDTINLTPYLLKSDTTAMLVKYIERGDTAAMLLNYPSTAGYGIIDAGKTWRADTTSPNGLATRLFAKTLPTSIGEGQVAYSNGTNLIGNNTVTHSGTGLVAQTFTHNDAVSRTWGATNYDGLLRINFSRNNYISATGANPMVYNAYSAHYFTLGSGQTFTMNNGWASWDGKLGLMSTATPTYDLDMNSSTNAIRLSKGTDAQRPTNAFGLLRGNTTGNGLEFGNGTTWDYLLRTSLTGGLGTSTHVGVFDTNGKLGGTSYLTHDPASTTFFTATHNSTRGIKFDVIDGIDRPNISTAGSTIWMKLSAPLLILNSSSNLINIGPSNGGPLQLFTNQAYFGGATAVGMSSTSAVPLGMYAGNTDTNTKSFVFNSASANSSANTDYFQINKNSVQQFTLRGSGFFGFGATTPAAKMHVSDNISAASWTTNGIGLRIDPATYTNTTSTGTVTNLYGHLIGSPTLAATSVTTYTDPITLQINPPVAGTNVTLTNNWALRTSRIWATEKMYISPSSFVLNNNNLAGSLYPTSSFVIYPGQQSSNHAAAVIQEHINAAGLTSVGVLGNLVTNGTVTSGTGSALLGELNVNPATASGNYAAVKGFNRSNGANANMYGFLSQVDYYSVVGGGAQSAAMYGFHGYSSGRNNAGGALFKGYSWAGFISGSHSGSNTGITDYNPLAINSGSLTGITNTWSYIDHNTTIGSGTVARNVLDLGYSTNAIRLPVGTTAQAPTLANGIMRLNTDLDAVTIGRNSGATLDVLGMLGKTQTWTGTNTFQVNGASTVYWTTSNTSYPSSAIKLGNVSNSPYTALFEGLTTTGNVGGFMFDRTSPGQVVVHGGSLGKVLIQGATGSTGYIHAIFNGQVVGGSNTNGAIEFTPALAINNAGIAGSGYVFNLKPSYNYVLTGGHTITAFHYVPTLTAMNNIANHYFIESEAGDVFLKNTAGTKLMMYSTVNNSGSPEIQLGNAVSSTTAGIIRGTASGAGARVNMDFLTNNILHMRINQGNNVNPSTQFFKHVIIGDSVTISSAVNNVGNKHIYFNASSNFNNRGNASIIAVPTGSNANIGGLGIAINNTGTNWANATTADFALYVNNDKKVGLGNTSPQRSLHVTGEARITDLVTDPPTQIVGADADGDLGALGLGNLSISGGVLTGANIYTADGTISTDRYVNLGSNGDYININGTSNSKSFQPYLSDSGSNGDAQFSLSHSYSPGNGVDQYADRNLRNFDGTRMDAYDYHRISQVMSGTKSKTGIMHRTLDYIGSGNDAQRIGYMSQMDSVSSTLAKGMTGVIMRSQTGTASPRRHFTGFGYGGIISENLAGGLQRFVNYTPDFTVQTNWNSSNTYYNWIRVKDMDAADTTSGDAIEVYNGKYAFPNERPETWRSYAIGYNNNTPTLMQFARDTFIEDVTLFSVGTLMNSCQELTVTSSMTSTAPSHMEIRFPDAANELRGKKIIVYSKKKDAGSFIPQIKVVGGVSRLYFTTNPAIGGTDPSDQSTLSIDDSVWSDHGTTFEFTCLRIDNTPSYRWVLKQR